MLSQTGGRFRFKTLSPPNSILFGLQVFSFPGLSCANIEAILALSRWTHQLGTRKRARDGHPEFACARLDRFGHLSGLLLTIRGALSSLSSAAMLSTNKDCSKYMPFVLLRGFLFARIEVRIGRSCTVPWPFSNTSIAILPSPCVAIQGNIEHLWSLIDGSYQKALDI